MEYSWKRNIHCMVRWGPNWLEFGRWILHTCLLQSATIQCLVAAIALVCIVYFFSVCLGLWADLISNGDHLRHQPGGCQIELFRVRGAARRNTTPCDDAKLRNLCSICQPSFGAKEVCADPDSIRFVQPSSGRDAYHPGPRIRMITR
jgi:hypothetical protein